MSSSAMRHSNESLNPRSGSGPGLRQRGNPLSRALGLLLLLGLLAAGLAGYLALPAPAAAQTPTPPANHDSDGDGLIEISTLAQLNAVHWDLDGNGAADVAGSNTDYAAAFPVSDGGSVCPADSTCTGYELTAGLDFDENDDGEITAADAAYWNNGHGWEPIGSASAPFSGVFEGNRHTISHLYLNRGGGDRGLFAVIASGGTVRNLNLADASVRGYTTGYYNTGGERVGALAGTNRGTISGVSATGSVSGEDHIGALAGSNYGTISESYATAAVNGRNQTGGLAGYNYGEGSISRSYATGAVTGRSSVGGLAGYNQGTVSESYAAGAVSGGSFTGGLVGYLIGGDSAIKNSYALGEVKGSAGSTSHGGLVGYRYQHDAGTITASYYDSAVQNIPGLDAVGEGPDTGAAGHTGLELAAPVGYAGIYQTWDGDSDVWDFGTATQFPALKADFDGDNTATWQEFGTYQNPRAQAMAVRRADADGDGLIEIGSLAQLNAVRYDPDGNGLPGEADAAAYDAAFPKVEDGSPSCIANATCVGYELSADLDFDENDDGEITAADAAYWNNGHGWDPIGNGSAPFSATFEGNRHTISHLYLARGGNDNGLFRVIAATGQVRNLGLEDVSVRNRHSGNDHLGAVAGTNRGTISRVSVTGTVSGARSKVGALAGINSGAISESYATATVSGRNYVGGLAGNNSGEGTVSRSYATGAVSGTYSVGGLAGSNGGTVSESYAAGTVSGSSRVGGLVGELYSGDDSAIQNSYALGEVKGSASSTSHGGLVGSRSQNNTVISASYYDSAVQNIPGLDAVGEGPDTGAAGHTGLELAAPVGYAGIYQTWDGDSDVWDFGTATQFPALKADFDGNGTATWQEFGYQVRQSLPLTATPSHDLKALLSWPDITEPAWTKTPTVSYALYRDGTEVTDYDGSSRSYTDAGLTNRQEYTYQVALLLDGAEVRRSKAVPMAAENRPHFGQAAIDNQVYMENTEIDTLTLPEATGGDGTLTYALTSVLPAGLSFDAAARTITGTPTEPQDAKEYTYIATDADGDEASLTFTIEVEETVAIARIDADSDGLIEIVSLAQLNAIRWDLDGDGMPAEGHETSYADAFPAAEGGSVCIAGTTCTGYELTANLDFDENGDGAITAADATYWHNGGGWEPIGLANGQFNGTLNGNGHTISNLYISRRLGRTYADGSPQNIAAQGLFGQLGADAVVRNLGLTQVNVSAEYIVGGLAGRNLGTIADSHVTGAVSGNNVVGGLTGDNWNIVKGSHAAVSVNGWKDVGGLAGENGHGGVISASYATGTVSGEKENAGGLVGYNGTLGVITGSYATGTVQGERLIRGGGLAGHNQGTISVSYATGAVATGLGYSGGLVGENSGTIAASYATGLVSGQRDTGSLVGQNSGTVNASYSTGPVRSTIPGHRVGGLAGSNSGTITASYVDTQTAGISLATDAEAAINAGGTGMTTAELQSPTGYTGIYADWNSDLDGDGDGDSPWDFGSNGQYPALQADFNGDDTATWQEFGYQLRQRPTLAATASGTQAELTWDAPPAAHWTDAPSLAYALYRDGERVSGYDGSSLSYTDTGLTLGQTYTYQVAALLGGVATQHSNQVALVAGEGPDRAALTAFYHAAGGADWTNNGGWLSSRPLGEWYGVTTSADGRVVGLSLIDNNLSGTLPADLGKLERLEVLTLDRNALTGAIPSELGNLRNLARLSMNRNQLTGAIPSELGSLSNLSIIGLARNSLSGSLPTSLGNLSGLTKLSLHDNTALSGPLPSGFTGLANLQRLAVANSGICAPNSEAFSEWLDTVPDKPGGVQTCE